jgi:hypothetical protein
MNIIKLWNLYADGDSQWDSLTEGEKLMFTASLEREECAKLCIQMANRCDDIRKAALEVAAENIITRGTT